MKQFHWIVQQIPLYLWGPGLHLGATVSLGVGDCHSGFSPHGLSLRGFSVSQARLGLEQTLECVARAQPLCCQALRRNGTATMSKWRSKTTLGPEVYSGGQGNI